MIKKKKKEAAAVAVASAFQCTLQLIMDSTIS